VKGYKVSTTISEYIDVRKKIKELDCIDPSGFALLPSNFEGSNNISEFLQQSDSATVRTLFRTSQIPLDEIVSKEQRGAYVQNNAFDWISPTIFISASLITQSPNLISVALSVLANYVTDFFQGTKNDATVKLEIVVETTKTNKYKRVSYSGPVEGMKSLPEAIKAASDE
jgi:hypothetical protein